MQPNMSAGLAIRDKRLLTIHNIKHGNIRIEPPGGKRREGESLYGCLVRETFEELGIIVRPYRLFGIYKTVSPEGEFNVAMYLTRIVSGEPVIQEREKLKHSAFGWYDIEELIRFNERGLLVPNLNAALPGLLAKGYLEI